MFDYFATGDPISILNDSADIILRTVITIAVLFVLTKLMGQKQISQLSFFDYVEGITIGSIAAQLAVDPSTPHLFPILAMIVCALISIISSRLSQKSVKARKLLIGRPITLIKDGNILLEGLNRAQLNINELLSECRVAGYFDISQIAYCYMETSGQFSYIPSEGNRPTVLSDLPRADRQAEAQTRPAVNAIIDGMIMTDSCSEAGIEPATLIQCLSKASLRTDDVLLGVITPDGFTIYNKKDGRAINLTASVTGTV